MFVDSEVLTFVAFGVPMSFWGYTFLIFVVRTFVVPKLIGVPPAAELFPDHPQQQRQIQHRSNNPNSTIIHTMAPTEATQQQYHLALQFLHTTQYRYCII